MTTLHLDGGDIAAVWSGADGALTIDLTEEGARTLIASGARLSALQHLPVGERRAAWLAELSNEELTALATAHMGGPEADVMTEVVRRMHLILDRIRPAIKALQVC